MINGEILKRLIKEKGYSIRAFAKKCGIPDSTLRSLLQNAGKASVDTIITICYHLRITVEELECMSKGIEYKGKSFEEVQTYISQHSSHLSVEEKNKLIKLILEDNNDEEQHKKNA